MDKAKAAITDFMGRSGQHDTSVHETVAPAVQHEVVKPHMHEEINTAVDKEVHQDHYHRTVQPVYDREVLPEKHEAKLGAVQHREFDHRDHDTTKRHLVQEQAQFKDVRIVEDATASRSVAATVGGEHVHHHIHETIQPVIHKEVIQPNVVHTTVPIHEVHHNKATHHETTSLPAMSIEQFKSQGGTLSGREERYDEFKGVPKNIGGTAGGLGAVRGLEHQSGHHSKENARHGDFHDTAYHESGADIRKGGLTHNATDAGTRGVTGHHDHHTDRGLTGTSATGALSGHDQHHHADRGTAGQGNLTGHHSHDTTTTGTHKKPSLMDKLNPKVDSNGDGKAGFMK